MSIDEKALKIAIEAFNKHLADSSPKGVVRTTIQAYEAAKVPDQPVDCRAAFEKWFLNNTWIGTNADACWTAWKAATSIMRESGDDAEEEAWQALCKVLEDRSYIGASRTDFADELWESIRPYLCTMKPSVKDDFMTFEQWRDQYPEYLEKMGFKP